ncbi:Ubiquinone/menaquinone biosynthesis C-methyltransferase UbiE [Halomicronema hongdechloris C2206]|uniref:Ubiquinone/menaquinone biosynthesis C-methyltransferase UbiE n=1 Tax=Halomicronema hongdechloris C2206 TaxID=1641165 RepID=A0A1Z3HHQ6_9CYAN|nr:class I SAM-dependent methyltransferase [Halomicronema hongdechloris]ASC69849.1 Ubiquinone/menaquinone biosynthesis C-methyltransferase UbiE [Halomicronema hongdechloris C2206]
MTSSITQNSLYQPLHPFLVADHTVDFSGPIPVDTALTPSPAITANSNYFDHPDWALNYFNACHRTDGFKERWQAATGTWDDKIVVDVGCGPGNVFATVGGQPRLLIGVDVALGSLALAQEIGYVPLLADAHQMPLRSHMADLVLLNATLHHCENMERVLIEAARLVKPGGKLVIDHDPQLQAWNYRGLGMAMYRIRHHLYARCLKDLDMDPHERTYALATEIHHHPGHGVTAEFFRGSLGQLGFQVNLYPHNQTLGAETLQGQRGSFPHWRYPLGQILSGINPWSDEAALSLLCVAVRAVADYS